MEDIRWTMSFFLRPLGISPKNWLAEQKRWTNYGLRLLQNPVQKNELHWLSGSAVWGRRSCYRVPKGRELTESEQDRIVNLLMAWLERRKNMNNPIPTTGRSMISTTVHPIPASIKHSRNFDFMRWLVKTTINLKIWKSDIISGVIVALVSIPISMGYGRVVEHRKKSSETTKKP